jgi:M6 family metalloprotease-like protein
MKCRDKISLTIGITYKVFLGFVAKILFNRYTLISTLIVLFSMASYPGYAIFSSISNGRVMVNEFIKLGDDYYINSNFIERSGPTLPLIGDVDVWIIFVEFQDVKHLSSTISMKNLMNNVADYYSEASLEQLNIIWRSVDGVVWLTLPNTMSYYGDPSGSSPDGRYIEFIEDSIAASDPYIDYSQVDSLLIIHAGDDEASTGNPSDIWSFAIIGGYWSTDEGSFQINIGVGAETDPLGVIAHELGHVFWLPDLYDYDGVKEFIGAWGLMAYGSWNGPPSDPGRYPAHPIGWSKMYLGWFQGRIYEIKLSSSFFEINLTPTEYMGNISLIKINLPDGKYLTIEGRVKTGYDSYLPSSGVLISLIDEGRQSGRGIVRIIDSTPGDNDVDNGAWAIGTTYINSTYNLRIDILNFKNNEFLIRIYTEYQAGEAVIQDLRSTYGVDEIDLLINKNTKLIYNYTPVLFNITAFNIDAGNRGAYFFVRFVFNTTVITSDVEYVARGTQINWIISADDIALTTGIYISRVELWWNDGGGYRVADRVYFNVSVVKFQFEYTYNPNSILQNQLTDLYLTIYNTGDDTLWNITLSIVDSDGLEISPTIAGLGDLAVNEYTTMRYSIFAATTIIPGQKIIRIALSYYDFSGGFWTVTFDLTIEVIGDIIIIDEIYQSGYRVDVGSSQLIGFHATLYSTGSSIEGAKLYVNGTLYITNSDGWIYIEVFSDTVGIKKWVITAAEYDNITDFIMIVPNPEIIWDKLLIMDAWASDYRVDVSRHAYIWFNITYLYDGTSFSDLDGEVYINGLKAFYNESLASWFINISYDSVGHRDFTVTDIINIRYNVSIFDSLIPPVRVVWDKVLITLYTDDDRIDIGSKATIYFDAIYEYDGQKFNGIIYLNDSLIKKEVGIWKFTVESIDDPLYGLKLFESNIIAIIYDAVVVQLSAVDDRIDVGSTAEIDIYAYYAYDKTQFTGDILLNDTLVKQTVGKYTFTVIWIDDPVYGLSRFISNDVAIIFDKVVLEVDVLSRRVNIGSSANIVINAYYAYDKSEFVGSYQFNDSIRKEVVGKYRFIIKNINDQKFGLTVFDTNVFEVIFDYVVFELSTRYSRISVGSTAEIYINAYYAYDHMPFVGSYRLNDTLTKTDIGEYTYRVILERDDLYGLTYYVSQRISIIFDRINYEIDIDTSRLGASKLVLSLYYDYDGTAVDNAEITVNGVEFYQISPGMYEAIIQGFTIQSTLQIRIVIPGFKDLEIQKRIIHTLHILIVAAIAIILSGYPIYLLYKKSGTS